MARRKGDTSREIYSSKSYYLSLTQYLYSNQAREHCQQNKSLTLQKASQSEGSQVEVTVDLADRYFEALAVDDELELATITEVLGLKACVDGLSAQEVEARNQVRLSREALSEIVGRPITDRLSRIRNDIALEAPVLPLQG